MKTMETELIPGLPEEMALQCLLRLPPTAHRAARLVSRRWKSLIDNPAFYQERRRTGNTRKIACLVQALLSPAHGKPASMLCYGVTVFDPALNEWHALAPISNYPTGLPLFCHLAGVDGELVLMGGWDPVTWEPVRDVWIYSFAAGRWRRGRDMPEARTFFAGAGTGDGRVYVAGGHDSGKRVLRSAVVYDVRRDEWEAVAEMGEGRDEGEGVMVGGEFWVVSGYGAEGRGRYVGSAEVFDPVTGRWRREEGVWPEGRRPRGCVGVAEEGRLVCWAAEAAEAAEARVGTCGVRVGERVVVAGMGSVCAGEAMKFYLLRLGEVVEGSGRLESFEPPSEFSGFVQSGCCVEI